MSSTSENTEYSDNQAASPRRLRSRTRHFGAGTSTYVLSGRGGLRGTSIFRFKCSK